jgi:hypothetical protein
VTFGFVFTIGIAMLLANLVGSGVTCPRCLTQNPGAAGVCLTCDLPLPPGQRRASGAVGVRDPVHRIGHDVGMTRSRMVPMLTARARRLVVIALIPMSLSAASCCGRPRKSAWCDAR